ncbi:MAG TPA: hypothetical protein P5550_07370 [Bacteroidales bacterium]|nr:hypothetical protein [Bacteroidales bacterium]
MVQQIITLLILALVAGILIRKVWLRFRGSKVTDPCHGCGDGCDGCAVMQIKQEMEKRKTEDTARAMDAPTAVRHGRGG